MKEITLFELIGIIYSIFIMDTIKSEDIDRFFL